MDWSKERTLGNSQSFEMNRVSCNFSIPISSEIRLWIHTHTICRGMNIHLPAILMLGLPGFWPTGQRPLCASLGNRTRHSKRFPSASTKVMFSSSFGLSWQKMPPAVWAASTKRGKTTKIEIRSISSQHFRSYPPCCCFISLIFCWIFEIGKTLVLQSWWTSSLD